jgi:hypothetical protein
MMEIYLEIILGMLALLVISTVGWALFAFFEWRHSWRRVRGPVRVWTPWDLEQSRHRARQGIARSHK